MSSSRPSTDQHGTAKDSKRVVSGRVREIGERARKRTIANTGTEEGAEPGMKLEKDQPVRQEANIASSPPLPVVRGRAPEPSSSSSADEGVDEIRLLNRRKRRKKVDDTTPANASPKPTATPKRLGGPLTPSFSIARSDVDRQTACYLQVLRDLELSDATVAGAITELVKAKLKDVIISPDLAITSRVPLILEQLRQHGVSASKCEEMTERLQRAEATQLARRISAHFTDYDLLEMVSSALCTVVENANLVENLHHNYSRRSTSAHASSGLTVSVGPDSSQALPTPK